MIWLKWRGSSTQHAVRSSYMGTWWTACGMRFTHEPERDEKALRAEKCLICRRETDEMQPGLFR